MAEAGEPSGESNTGNQASSSIESPLPHIEGISADPSKPPVFDPIRAVKVDEEGQTRIAAEQASRAASKDKKDILDRIKAGERWMIFFTAIVACTTVAQYVQSCNNNTSTATQVDRLICAANGVNESAHSFSTSAQNINAGIGNAVTQLGVQASKMEAARKSSEKEAEKSLQSSIDNFYRDQRPWVAVNPVIDGTLYFQDGNAWLLMSVEMKNVGHSPARYVKPWVTLVAGFASPSSEGMEGSCSLLKKHPTAEQTNGWTLFPGQSGTQLYPAVSMKKDIDSVVAKGAIPGKVGFSLIVCADYTATFDTVTHHQTRQGFSVFRTDDKTGRQMADFDPKITQPYKVGLILQPAGFAD